MVPASDPRHRLEHSSSSFLTEPDGPSAVPGQSDPSAWRTGVDADRRKRRRRINDQRLALRRLTVGAAVTAAGLNVLLFTQASVEQLGAGGVQDAIVSIAQGLFPGAGLRPPASAPVPSQKPVTTTGAS
jgi:hypothetical protein